MLQYKTQLCKLIKGGNFKEHVYLSNLFPFSASALFLHLLFPVSYPLQPDPAMKRETQAVWWTVTSDPSARPGPWFRGSLVWSIAHLKDTIQGAVSPRESQQRSAWRSHVHLTMKSIRIYDQRLSLRRGLRKTVFLLMFRCYPPAGMVDNRKIIREASGYSNIKIWWCSVIVHRRRGNTDAITTKSREEQISQCGERFLWLFSDFVFLHQILSLLESISTGWVQAAAFHLWEGKHFSSVRGEMNPQELDLKRSITQGICRPESHHTHFKRSLGFLMLLLTAVGNRLTHSFVYLTNAGVWTAKQCGGPLLDPWWSCRLGLLLVHLFQTVVFSSPHSHRRGKGMLSFGTLDPLGSTFCTVSLLCLKHCFLYDVGLSVSDVFSTVTLSTIH